MNNRDSHKNPKFVLLANKHYIRLFSFVSHFTHCMQSLDVNIFQSYKKHSVNVIRKALSKFHLIYTLKRFCNDLDDIREHTFKKFIIRFAFEKIEKWSINSSNCINQLKRFAASNIKTKADESVQILHEELINEEIDEFFLFLSSSIKSQTCKNVENKLLKWFSRIRDKTQWSDSFRSVKFEQFIENTMCIMTESQFKDFELTMI
jgi:hypothetical protein